MAKPRTRQLANVVPRAKSNASKAPPPVAPPLRNGHAVVLARILDVVRRRNRRAIRLPVIALSTADEGELRDADEQQLSSSGLRLAQSGSPDAWRAHLADVFRRRYGVELTFDEAASDELPRTGRSSGVRPVGENED